MECRLRWVIMTLFVLASAACCYAIREDGHTVITPEESLVLSDPDQLFRSDGGTLELWSSTSRALRDANVGAARVTLETRGLALFKYSDAPQLAYVLQGEAKIGLSFPWEQSVRVRSARQGDVIAIPRGVGHWWYNSGDERFMVISVADTSNGLKSGEYDMFYLNGGLASSKDARSVLHGFNEELLSQAWDVDRDIVRQIRESQEGRGIIRLSDDIDIPKDSDDDEESEYIYNIDEAKADIDVSNGGTFRILTSKLLPILTEVRLTTIRVKLVQDALFAPSFASNAHVLIYITEGSGRIQIVGSGEQLLDCEVRKGSMVVVPQFHPDIKKAGDEGLEYVAISTSDKPIFSFLAGSNAIERGIPVSVLAASNNVPIDVQQEILEHRQNDAVIFPPRGKSGATSASTAEAIKKLNSVFYTHFEELKVVLKAKRLFQH